MQQGEPLIFAFLVCAIPLLGTYPPAAAWLCNPIRRRAVGAVVSGAAIIGVATWAIGILNSALSVALVAPLYQFALLWRLYRRFASKHKREPVDTAFNFSGGMLHDRVFALSVSLGGILPVFGVLALAR